MTPAPSGSAAARVIALRAGLAAQVRAFFADRGVIEADTPLLYPHAPPDPHQHCLYASGPDGVARGWLQPSPEFALKRLLAAGAPDVYQLGKAFRADEAGTCHRPEFTLLEWYRRGWDYRALMDETVALVGAVTPVATVQRRAWRELLARCCGADPLDAPEPALWTALADAGIELSPAARGGGRAAALDLLFTHVAEPRLLAHGAVLVHDFPAWQTALARRCPHDDRLAERFELYVNGLELANGYTELTDPAEARARFAADNAARVAAGLPAMPPDEALLAALHRMPDCAGVALGFDRLAMLVAGVTDIRAVLALELAPDA